MITAKVKKQCTDPEANLTIWLGTAQAVFNVRKISVSGAEVRSKKVKITILYPVSKAQGANKESGKRIGQNLPVTEMVMAKQSDVERLRLWQKPNISGPYQFARLPVAVSEEEHDEQNEK